MASISYTALNSGLYDAAAPFFTYLISKTLEKKHALFADEHYFFGHKADLKRYESDLIKAKKKHDHFLQTKGQFGKKTRCNKYPYDFKVKRKMGPLNGHKDPNITYRMKSNRHDTTWFNDYSKDMISTVMNVDVLCRGGHLRVNDNYFLLNVTSYYISYT